MMVLRCWKSFSVPIRHVQQISGVSLRGKAVINSSADAKALLSDDQSMLLTRQHSQSVSSYKKGPLQNQTVLKAHLSTQMGSQFFCTLGSLQISQGTIWKTKTEIWLVLSLQNAVKEVKQLYIVVNLIHVFWLQNRKNAFRTYSGLKTAICYTHPYDI